MKGWIHQRNIKVWEWPSWSLDRGLSGHIWAAQSCVHRKCPPSLTDLERFCGKEWANIAKAHRLLPKQAVKHSAATISESSIFGS